MTDLIIILVGLNIVLWFTVMTMFFKKDETIELEEQIKRINKNYKQIEQNYKKEIKKISDRIDNIFKIKDDE